MAKAIEQLPMPFVEGGDGVDVQIHAKSVAELIGDELRIDAFIQETGVGGTASFMMNGFPKPTVFSVRLPSGPNPEGR